MCVCVRMYACMCAYVVIAPVDTQLCIHSFIQYSVVCYIYYASIHPHADTPSSSEIRLVGGRNQYEGRVEVNRSGEWQTVCDYLWDIAEAEVVCRWLGYGYAILAIQGAAFGQGLGRQWEKKWHCNGYETSLDDCSSSSSPLFCSHSQDASVICSGGGKT